MSAVPNLFLSLLRLLQRDGPLFFVKCARYAVSAKAWRWLMGGVDGADPSFPRSLRDNVRAVARSPWFDADWVLREYPEAAAAGCSPAEWYLRKADPVLAHPGPEFSDDEYLALNFDAFLDGVQPLLHFERSLRTESRQVSFLETEGEFSAAARPVRASFGRTPACHRRTALFAAHSGDGRIPDRVLLYLRGLREVADNVVFVSSNPLLPGEEDKLRDLASEVLCEVHGEYDFGSWKRAWGVARRNGLLDSDVADEAILANDSCYGPVFPFGEAFGRMAARQCDFWGFTANVPDANSKIGGGREHIQSYFLVFRRKVLDSDAIDRFLAGVVPLGDRLRVIERYESRLTSTLSAEGFSWDVYLPREYRRKVRGDPSVKKPISAMRDFRMPLLKRKALGPDAAQSATDTIAFLRSVNPELARLVSPVVFSPVSSEERLARIAARSSLHPRDLAANEARLRGRVAAGERIGALFFVSDADAFSAHGVFEAMLASPDGQFSPRLCVVPDFRIPDSERCAEECLARLKARYPGAAIDIARRDEDGIWPDEIGETPVVFYPTAAHAFPYPYAPRWAVGRRFLPALVFDAALAGPGPLEQEFARQNYAYFWKVFFTDREAFDLYAKCSIRKGENAELAGGCGIDELLLSGVSANANQKPLENE